MIKKTMFALALTVLLCLAFVLGACQTTLSDHATVTFNFNYDGAPKAVVEKVTGGKVDKPQNPTRNGYDFVCWSTDTYGINEFDFNTEVNGDLRLFAVWKQTSCTVTFMLPDGSVFDTQTVEVGKTVTVPTTAPTSADGEFRQWCLTSNGAYVYDFSQPVNGDITLYANFRRTKAVVTFVCYEGKSFTVTTDLDAPVARPQDPTREDYAFNGWYTNVACTESFDFTSDVNDDTTLYAGWRKTVATVTLNYSYDGLATTTKVNIGDKLTKPTVPERTGYTFEGWFTNSDCTETFDFTTTIVDDITLYAKWNVISYEVTFLYNYNGALTEVFTVVSVGYGDPVGMPTDDPAMSGYVFTGWYTTADCNEQYDFDKAVTGTLTLYAGWKEDSTSEDGIRIRFFDGVTVYATVTLEKAGRLKDKRPQDPKKLGFYFNGWSSSKDGTSKVNLTTKTFSSSTDLYAIWLTGYAFEAEYTDIATKLGQGMSLNCSGVSGLVRGDNVGRPSGVRPIDNMETAKLSNGYYVGNLFYSGAYLDFEINAEEEVNNAVLVLRLTPDIWDMVLTQDEYQVIVNGKQLGQSDGYSGVSLVGAIKEADTVDGETVAGEHYKRTFDNYTVTLKLHLNKGKNTIRLLTSNDHDHGATFNADTPLVDCLVIYSDVKLSWAACYPENVGQTMADVTYKVNY